MPWYFNAFLYSAVWEHTVRKVINKENTRDTSNSLVTYGFPLNCSSFIQSRSNDTKYEIEYLPVSLPNAKFRNTITTNKQVICGHKQNVHIRVRFAIIDKFYKTLLISHQICVCKRQWHLAVRRAHYRQWHCSGWSKVKVFLTQNGYWKLF